MKWGLAGAMLVMIALFQNCSSGLGASGGAVNNSASANSSVPGTITYQNVYADIFQPICMKCHTAPNGIGYEQSGYAFSTYTGALAAIVSGNAAASPMYQQVELGLNTGGTQGMPYGGPALTQAQVQEIYQWIQNGAPFD